MPLPTSPAWCGEQNRQLAFGNRQSYRRNRRLLDDFPFMPCRQDVLNLERVGHAQQACGTQTKRSTFSISCEGNTVAWA